MAEYIDRRQIRREANGILRDAQVPPRNFFLLYLILDGLMRLANFFANMGANSGSLLPFANPLGLFVTILVNLLSLILSAGCVLYCFALRRGERAEYLTLFDGFSFAGRIILLYLTEYLLIFAWALMPAFIFSVLAVVYGQDVILFSLLMIPLLIPPLVALYRYRFAILNLCENPELRPMEAISMSKRQTFGYKGQIFFLDLSFLGWMLLSYLPTIYLYVVNYMSLLGVSMPSLGSTAVSIALQLMWPIVVGLLFLPRYRMMEVGYFEIAQRTSGVSPHSDFRNQGPDNLGGYPPL